jgi:CheY-like chemotaxis protein
VERAEAAGCDAYVVKPADPNDLTETVSRLIAAARRRSA